MRNALLSLFEAPAGSTAGSVFAAPNNPVGAALFAFARLVARKGPALTRRQWVAAEDALRAAIDDCDSAEIESLFRLHGPRLAGNPSGRPQINPVRLCLRFQIKAAVRLLLPFADPLRVDEQFQDTLLFNAIFAENAEAVAFLASRADLSQDIVLHGDDDHPLDLIQSPVEAALGLLFRDDPLHGPVVLEIFESLLREAAAKPDPLRETLFTQAFECLRDSFRREAAGVSRPCPEDAKPARFAEACIQWAPPSVFEKTFASLGAAEPLRAYFEREALRRETDLSASQEGAATRRADALASPSSPASHALSPRRL